MPGRFLLPAPPDPTAAAAAAAAAAVPPAFVPGEPRPSVPGRRSYAQEWADRFAYFMSRPPLVKVLNLAAAGSDEATYKGNEFGLIYLTGAAGVRLDVRLNAPGSTPIPLYTEISLPFPFDKVFFSWPASAGGIAVVVLARVPWE